MSYLQCQDPYYPGLLFSGKVPPPFSLYYPWTSSIPNISNNGLMNEYYANLLNWYQCWYGGPYDWDGVCYDYDNVCYDTTPYQDPSVSMQFTIERLVSNVVPPPLPLSPLPFIPPPVPLPPPPTLVPTVVPAPPTTVVPTPTPVGPVPTVIPNPAAGTPIVVPSIPALATPQPDPARVLPPLPVIPPPPFAPIPFPNLPARILDTNLSDPWGIVLFNDIVWVTNRGSGLITNYNLLGEPLQPLINVFGPLNNIAQPTGIVYNPDLFAFQIVNGPISAPAKIIVATRDGTINGYNYSIDPNNSIIMVDNSADNSVYTGLAIFNRTLYATDFYNRKVDVFDANLKRRRNCAFNDEFTGNPIPSDFAPFNITNIGDFLYVTYAKQNPSDNQYPLAGAGFGFISIFTPDGKFFKRFVSGGPLNIPLGIIPAPSWFGYPAGALLVANFGDGTINVFGVDGACLGNMRDKFSNNICIDGLRGLAINPCYDRVIYWTASSNNLTSAYMGTINSCAPI